MSTPILTLAEVQALSGFTEGPWRVGKPNGGFHIIRTHETQSICGFPANKSYNEANAGIIAAAPALHATCLHLFAEVARLTAELEKPVAGPWEIIGDGLEVRRGPAGRLVLWDCGEPDVFWWHVNARSSRVDGGKRAADLALVAAGYRLVGGVFGEVSDG